MQVNTINLERVRKVKTRHQRLLTRVQTIREELQRFLEDDDDMAKLCLTRKQDLERAAGSTGFPLLLLTLPTSSKPRSLLHPSLLHGSAAGGLSSLGCVLVCKEGQNLTILYARKPKSIHLALPVLRLRALPLHFRTLRQCKACRARASKGARGFQDTARRPMAALSGLSGLCS